MTVTTTASSPTRPAGRRGIVAVLACAALVAVGAWIAHLYGGMIDLRVYRMGGSVLLHGDSLYDAKLPGGSDLPFTYPPFAAIAMVPLAAVPWGVAVVAWTTISVLCITALWRTSLTKTFWSFVTQRDGRE